MIYAPLKNERPRKSALLSRRQPHSPFTRLAMELATLPLLMAVVATAQDVSPQPAGPSVSEALRLNARFMRNGIVMLVLVAGTVALLYTWLQSGTPQTQKGYSEFYGDVKAGNITKVVQDGETLDVTTKGGEHRLQCAI